MIVHLGSCSWAQGLPNNLRPALFYSTSGRLVRLTMYVCIIM